MRGRLGVLARGVGAALLLGLLLLGLPAVLIAVIGLPSSLPSRAELLRRLTTPDDGTVFIAAAATVGWAAWVVFAVSTLLEAAALLRHRTARRPVAALAGPQHLAAQLLAAVALLAAGTGGQPSTAGARPAAVSLAADRPPTNPTPTAVLASAQPPPATPSVAPPIRHTTPAAAVGIEVEVHRGDTLWHLAERHYGDGEQWRRIAEANYGRRQPDGAALTDAHWIYPGWRLLVPGVTGSTQHGSPSAPYRTARRAPPAGAATPSASPDPRSRVDGGGQGRDRGAAAGEHRDVPQMAARPRGDGGAQGRDRGAAAGEHRGVRPAVPAAPATPAGGTPAERPAAGTTLSPSPRVREPEGETLPAAPLLVAFAGGGTLLAGVTLTALLRARRRQFRHRRPGRVVRTPPPELGATEKALLDAALGGAADVTWLNSALRGLARTLAPTEVPLPDVLAACLTGAQIRLVLARPHPAPPAPWRADGEGTRWTLQRDAPLDFTEAEIPFGFAPFPTLVTVGHSAAGEHWLLDLERIAALSLSGSAERCLDLARFLAAELAHNAWSEHLSVTLVGFGAEMAALNPLRLRYTEDLTAAVAGLRHALDRTVGLIAEGGVGVLDGRLRDGLGDGWAPQVLLIAPSVAAADGAGVQTLLAAMRDQPGRAAVALVLADTPDGAALGTRWQLRVDEAGTLHVPALGLELTAQQLPAEEAADLAALLALAGDVDDAPMPRPGGERPWDAYADAAGAPIPAPAVTLPRPARLRLVPDIEVTGLERTAPWMDSVLPLPTGAYLDRAAATEADVETLAPAVTGERRREIEDADPTLDADLAAWWDPHAAVPKLRVLGPVTLTAPGQPPAKRLGYYTEIVAYLATRPRGATREEIGAALHPHDPRIEEKTTIRSAMSVLRDWLGVNPRTGRDHLLDARSAAHRGVYRIEGLLLDAELFRRLRLRGTARGAAGLPDLQAALDLVTGEPFAEQRRGGYLWVVDDPRGERLDVVYLAMVIDLAHTVATAYLGAGQPEQAIDAAQRALTAGASDDIALLDLAVAHQQVGNTAEAEQYVQRILANHDAEVEEDLPPRTYDVLRRRHLLGGGPRRHQPRPNVNSGCAPPGRRSPEHR